MSSRIDYQGNSFRTLRMYNIYELYPLCLYVIDDGLVIDKKNLFICNDLLFVAEINQMS